MTAITKASPVNVRLTLGEWDEIYELLQDSVLDRAEALSYLIGGQLPDKTPTGLGAVVRATILSDPVPGTAVLVLCAATKVGDYLSWRDPQTGDWYELDQFRITEVLSQGIPWPT